MGTVAVAVLVATGLVNSFMLIGLAELPHVLTTTYNQLLAAKLVLFAVMLAFAAANRFRLTPALSRQAGDADVGGGVRALRRSSSVEAAVALAVLLIVAMLGALSPRAGLS